MRGRVVGAGLIPMLLLALTGCAGITAQQGAAGLAKQEATERAAEHATLTKHMPARYHDLGNGIGYAWAGGSACDAGGGGCAAVSLFAYSPCDSVYLEGDLHDAAGKDVGVINGSFDGMHANTSRTMTVQWDDPRGRTVALTHLDCQ